jgi:predicted Zn-dependent protease
VSFRFLLSTTAAGEAPFDLRDARDEQGDVYEPVTAEREPPALSIESAVGRYRALPANAPAGDVLNCGIELLSLGVETRELAIEAFTRARRLPGAESEACYWLGEAYIEAEQYGLAIHMLQESARAGETALALGRLLQLQTQEGLTAEAEATLTRLKRFAEGDGAGAA